MRIKNRVPFVPKPLGLEHSVPPFVGENAQNRSYSMRVPECYEHMHPVENSLLGNTNDLTMHRSHLGTLLKCSI